MKKDNNKLKTSFCTITTKNFIHLLFSFFICPCHFFSGRPSEFLLFSSVLQSVSLDLQLSFANFLVLSPD